MASIPPLRSRRSHADREGQRQRQQQQHRSSRIHHHTHTVPPYLGFYLLVLVVPFLSALDNGPAALAFTDPVPSRHRIALRQPIERQSRCYFPASFSCASFATASRPTMMPQTQIRHGREVTVMLHLVTEQDVLDAVERAENAWADALAAKEEADALSDQAEAASAAAEEQSKRVSSTSSPSSSSSILPREGGDGLLSRMTDVLRSALDAGDIFAEARRASDEADRLQDVADRALAESEEKLERHLADFPGSPLHDDNE